MKLRVSHSAKDVYTSCSEKYRLQYIEKLRGPKIFSSLFFGSALDEAFSRLLIEKKKELTDKEKELLPYTPEKLFYKNMMETSDPQKRDAKVLIPVYLHADYYATDYEEELLTSSHVLLITDSDPELQNWTLQDVKDFMANCKEMKKNKQRLTPEDYKLSNYITWLSLVEKGFLMVEAYRSQIIPQIEEVFSIQKEIAITNEFGDVIPGFIDFEAKFVGDPDIYVCDNKTSKDAYPADSVVNSPQLSTYCEAVGRTHGAYVVVRKKIFKKAPKIQTQIVK